MADAAPPDEQSIAHDTPNRESDGDTRKRTADVGDGQEHYKRPRQTSPLKQQETMIEKKENVNHPQPLTSNAGNDTQSVSRRHDLATSHLSSSQKERLDRAKAYAKQVKFQLMAEKATPVVAQPAALPPALLSANPHLASGVDVRTLSVLSRIYVGSINFELNEGHLKAVFSQFGSVKSVSMSIDPTTMRHKGFCFVEFDTPEAASLALESMNGADLGGRQLKVGRPNNYTAASSVGIPIPPKSRIYVANINELITEDNMHSIFEAFGKIKKCILLPDLLTRKHKGYGFIEFEEEASALAAMQSMNGFEIGGQQLRVSRCIIGGPLGQGMKALDSVPVPSRPFVPFQGGPSADIMSKVNANIEHLGLHKKFQSHATSTSFLNNDPSAATRAAIAQIAKDQAARIQGSYVDLVSKEENMHINASQRYAVMQKLAASREEASSVLLVQNAVSASEVDDSLKEEFSEECKKFGTVTSVKIQTSSSDASESYLGGEEARRKPGDDDVKIFVEFQLTEEAEKAKKALDGRWFGGRQLKARVLLKADLKKANFASI